MTELDKTIDLSQFTLGKALGKGSFGEVFEIREKTTGNSYAAKIILNPIDPTQKDIILNLLREVNINASINHPSILQFIGFSATDFENNAKPVIITELASNGSLNNVVEYENKGLCIPGWNDTKKIITLFGIASGMSYLHSHDILHRDLKLENILVDDRLFPKITDFGLSKVKHENGFASSTQSVLCIKGTPSYLSPEIIQDLEYTKAGDVYAFGIVAYEILTTNRAFAGYTIPQLIAAVLNGKRPNIDDTVPESYKQLIERCWQQKPTDRPTFDEIVEELQNSKFITPTIEEEDYLTYVEFVQTYQTTYEENKKIITLEDIIKNYQSSTFEKVSLTDYTKQIKSKRILPATIYGELNESCQKLVDESANDAEKQFFVGKYLIEGIKNFPIEIEYGIKYLERSSDDGCIDAAVYLSELYYKGELIPKNINKSKEYLFKYESSDDGRIYNALGQILKKENFLKEARQYFAKGSTKFNTKSMYKYALMLMGGEGGSCDVDEAMKYFNLSKNQGYTKSAKYPVIYEELNQNQFFSHLSPETKSLLIKQSISNSQIPIQQINEMKFNLPLKMSCRDTEIFFQDNLFSQSCFNDILETFPKVSIDIKYPSELFLSIYEKVSEIKIKFNDKIDVCIFILDSTTSIKCNGFSKLSSLTQIIIPSSVIQINDYSFYGCSSLTQITIPSSVTKIGFSAFNGCSSLTQITIPNSVTQINDSTFNGCSSLTQITIPSSVTRIGNSAFRECTSLKQIIIPSSVSQIKDYAFNGCSFLNQITFETPSSVTEIESNSFSKCSSLSQIIIPSSVTKIGDSAYNGCLSLKQITISSSVTVIGNSAFRECTSLTQIIIPSSVSQIKDYAFSGCPLLKKITFETPSSVTKIEYNSFSKCSSLSQITIPSSVTKIGFSAFNGCRSLKQITIPSSVTNIGDSAFNECKSLEQITFEIPSSVSEIGIYAFCECKSLKQITIPSSITKIGFSSFRECSSLTEITFETPSSITTIRDSTFSKCSSLKQITIPSFVTEIENSAFKECSSLTRITIPSSVSTIGESTFNECTSLAQIIIPSSVTKIKDYAFRKCSSLLKITFEIPSSITHLGYSIFLGCSSLTQVTIPSSVTEIENSVFKECSSITQITIPSSVTKIGDSAFRGCSSLKQITVPSTVSQIRDYVFYGCSSLKQITIPSSITDIGNYAFSGCSSLVQITIPSSVTKIGDFAFANCSSLKPIKMPTSVQSIGKNAFDGCKEQNCNIQ